MSTQFDTTNQQAPYQQDPRQQGSGRSRSRIWVAVIGAVAAAALVALAVVLSVGHSSAAPATTGPSASTSAPANPATPGTTGTRKLRHLGHPIPPGHPGPALGRGDAAAAGTGPAELLRGPGRWRHGAADDRGDQGPAASGGPAADRPDERRHPGRPGQLPGPRQQPDGREQLIQAPIPSASDRKAGTVCPGLRPFLPESIRPRSAGAIAPRSAAVPAVPAGRTSRRCCPGDTPRPCG